jgi:ATP-binding cassette subfamily B protein
MATFRDVVRYYQPYWTIALFSIAASSLFELVDLAVPYAIGQILNVLSGQRLDQPLHNLVNWVAEATRQPPNPSIAVAVLLSVIFLLTVVRAPLQPWLTAWFHWDIPLRTRRDHTGKTIERILTLPLEFYDENNPGRITGRIARGIANHTWTYPEVAGQMIPKLVRILGIFVCIWVIEWQVALLFLLSFIVILSFTLSGLRRLVGMGQQLDRYVENTESRTSEIITNIKTVKAFATEAAELKRQKQRLQRELKIADYKIHKGFVGLLTWQRLVIQLSLFTVLALILWATLQGQISLGHFITTLTIASMAYGELEPISNLAEVFARRYASMLGFHEFMQFPVGTDATSLAQPEAVRHYQFKGKLHFSQVTFGYDPRYPVLQDIDLQIEPRQTVALVGHSGSGKSTLMKLLFRYFEPQSGRILIDGQDIRLLDVTGYRQRLAIVHQEVDVFNGTLLDNITYGCPQATLAEVEAVCRIARVDEFIHLLPKGYYTQVGERGVRLSGGQRQRLGIARALLVNPDVLVFDEATSSLDYESERSIQLAMQSILGTRTTLIIAHRLSTVREADKIVVLDKGRIVEVGNHEELINHSGVYHRLHALQAAGDLLACSNSRLGELL